VRNGALFANHGTNFLVYTGVAVQVWSEPRIYHRLQSWWLALAQSCPGWATRSRESRYKVDRSQKTVKV